MKSIIVILIPFIIISCSVDPAPVTEEVFETETTIHNDQRVSEINFTYDKVNKQADLDVAFLPGTYAIGEDTYKDNELVNSKTPIHRLTLTTSFKNIYVHKTINFAKSYKIEIYNYEYDTNDTTLVTNKELLAEAMVIKK